MNISNIFFRYVYLITNNINSYLIIILTLVSVIGDFLVFHTKLHLFRALFDNATHATIGGLSWLIFCLNIKNSSAVQNLIEIGLCAGIASIIDIDHFISAKSLYLKDALNLHKRPFLHCSTFPVVFCLLCLLVSWVFHVDSGRKLSLIVLTAFASHHTRDATRRGYWVYPFGATPAIPYSVYIGLTCFIPYFVCFLYSCTSIKHYRYLSKESVI